jgi:transcription antitermination factor NusG
VFQAGNAPDDNSAKSRNWQIQAILKGGVQMEAMMGCNQVPEFSNTAAIVAKETENWFAVQTKARHEQVVARRLNEKGVITFYPTVTEIHRWSDRKKSLEMPLFNCYLFVKLTPSNEDRQKVLRVNSVLGFAGDPGWGTSIPQDQIDAVNILVKKQVPYSCHPFLKVGQRVRIRNGPLSGLEGILHSRQGDRKLVISVDAMQRSLAVQIDGYDVELV